MKTYNSIDDYIAAQPVEYQASLEKIRQTIRETAPEAEEYIGYGMPGFRYCGKPLVYFAYTKKHIGFYPTPGPIVYFEKELTRYSTSKGAIQFSHSQEFPFALAKKIIQFRMLEIHP